MNKKRQETNILKMTNKWKTIFLMNVISSIHRTMAAEQDQRPKVLVTNRETPQKGVDILRQKCDVFFPDNHPASREDILKLVPEADGIMWVGHHALNGEVLDLGIPKLKAVSTMSAGMDYVDIAEFKRRNFPLGYTPTVLNDAVADMAIGLMIAAGRRFHEGRLHIDNSQWKSTPRWLLGRDIKGSTCGIIGLGGIGQTIAERLKGFNVGQIIYSGRNIKPEGTKLGATFVTQAELLKESDFVFIAVPLTNSTRHMINATTLAQMKSTAVLINIARGEIVDQDALVKALKDGTIMAAGLDVMTPEPLPADHELLKLPNAVIVPHLGSATTRTRDDMSVIAAHNVLAGIEGSPMLSPYPY